MGLLAGMAVIILQPGFAGAGLILEFPGIGLVLGPVKSDVCITLLYLCIAHLHAVLPRHGGKVSQLM